MRNLVDASGMIDRLSCQSSPESLKLFFRTLVKGEKDGGVFHALEQGMRFIDIRNRGPRPGGRAEIAKARIIQTMEDRISEET